MSEAPGEHPVERDEALARSQEVEQESASAVRLFDVRRIIGGLFVVYGVVVGIIGLTDSASAIHKAQGVNINLWTGIGMLVLGLLFLLWLWLRPAKPPDAAAQQASDTPAE